LPGSQERIWTRLSWYSKRRIACADVLKLAWISYRTDAFRVETKPVHPPHDAGMFDLDAAIHNDLHSTFFSNPNAFVTDDTKL
jgi:hypothetical protein